MFAQILAVVLFLLMFILIITEKWERHVVTLGCALLTLILVFGVGLRSMSAVTETLNLYQLGDDCFCSRNDDHGRRNGESRIFPLAVHAPCQAGKISGSAVIS